MPISENIVGHKIPGRSVEVTARMLMAYAAGIGECSPCYFDDASENGIVAPSTFCAALEWPVINERGVGGDAFGITNDDVVHIVRTGQDSTFHRAIEPGDKLNTSGRITQIKETSAGPMMVEKLETVLEETQEPVVTSWVSWILRGGALEGGDRAIEEVPELQLEKPEAGELVTTEIFIPRKAPHVYSECSGIWNPINTQRKVALAAGLPDIILHGMATWSIAGREILKTQGHNNAHRMKRFTAKFQAMIVPGATIRIQQGRCRTYPEAVYYCIENQKGETAASGYALLEAL